MRVTLGEVVAAGPGKIALLEAIREHGSISAAARSMGMSYRRAWLLVQEMNGAMRTPAVVSEHGGEARGGTRLTEAGEEMVRRYRRIEAVAASACATEIDALLALLA
jgi:molybdate transport system regulatory protein